MPKVGDKELCTHFAMTYEDCYTGSRSTFQFPSRVNHSVSIPCSMDRTSWFNKVDAVRLYASYGFTFTKGADLRS